MADSEKKKTKADKDLAKVGDFFKGLGKKMAIPPPKAESPKKNIFAGIGDPFKKKKKEPAAPAGGGGAAASAEPVGPVPVSKGQRKRRAAGDSAESTTGHCRSGRLLGAIQHLTAVVREKPELAPMMFRAAVAKVLANRLASQIVTSSAVVLNNILPSTDPYLLADAMKTYMKQQPNPLIEFDFYEPVIKIVSETRDEEEAASKIAALFKDEESGNDTTAVKTVFAFLAELLGMVEGDAEAAKLLPYTMGPCLMWPETPPATLEEMTLLKNVPKAVGIIMRNYDKIFHGLGHGQPENEPAGAVDPAASKGEPPLSPDEVTEEEAAREAAAKAAAEEAAAAAAAEATAAAEAKAQAAADAQAAKAAKEAAKAAELIAQQAAELEELKAAQAAELAALDEADRAAALIRQEEERAEALARMARLKPQSLSGAIQAALDLVPDYLTDCRDALNEALRVAELEESIADDPLQGDMDLWARVFSFLGDAEMGRCSLVCDTWLQANSQTETAAERWKEAACRMLVDDFGEEMLPALLALPDTEENLHGTPNPWYSITSRLAICEYWGVPETDDGEPCTHMVVDISGDVLVVGAALPDARPIKVTTTVTVSDLNFVEAMEAKIIAALDRVLGSHSFLADTSSLLVLEGKGPSWNANRKALVKMIYNRFSPVSLRITSGTEAGFLVCGQKDGLVVDSGLSYTRIVPIIDLTPLNFATAMLPLGGEDVSRVLARMLEEQGQSWPPAVVDKIKVKHVYCSESGDLDEEEAEVEEVEYSLPDGSVVPLRAERFRPAEVVFSPGIVGKYCLGVAEQIMDIVERCPIDTRKALLGNVFLIGGNCCVKGFSARLKSELSKLAWEGVRGSIKIDAHDTETAMYPYLGGTVLTDEYHERMEQFVPKEVFDENPGEAMKRLYPHQR